jgi:glutathione S-transferase
VNSALGIDEKGPMMVLYHSPLTRSVRIRWLLEELDLPYELVRVDFLPPAKNFFSQATPTGKLPTLEDGDVVMCESGAIVEYILERYGEGRLAPAVGTPERASYLQWLHFAESTAYSPVGVVVWLTAYREDAADHAQLIEDARARTDQGFAFLERELGDKSYLLGESFSAADIMMTFTLVAARFARVLDSRYPRLNDYVDRIMQRPALQKTMAIQ